MQKIESLLQKITPQDGQSLPALCTVRPNPLSDRDLDKIDNALLGVCESKDVYGQVPVRDAKGEIIDWKFDKIGRRQIYNPTMRSDLRDALLRPASRKTIAYWLSRLGSHKRVTTGGEALAVRVSDISSELEGVSEWAVVQVYRDLWQQDGAFYPESGNILKMIREKDQDLRAQLIPKPPAPPQKTLQEKSVETQRMPWEGYTLDAMPDEIRKELIRFCKQFPAPAISVIYCRSYGIDYTALQSAVDTLPVG